MTDRDNITLPREVVENAARRLEDSVYKYLTMPVREEDFAYERQRVAAALRFAYERQRAAAALRIHLAAPKQEPQHPGYVIGSHWLETAYSRICAGEAEAEVLRDCGWERVDEALRRDAEKWRKSRAKYIAWLKGGKAETMGDMT